MTTPHFLAPFHRNTFVTSDNTSIVYYKNFKQDPQVPVLVFNYGLVCSHYHWEPQILFFHQQGFPILVHDYRGHHESGGKDAKEYITLKQICQDTYDLLMSENITNVAMLGHSMGVNICTNFTLMYPSIVSCLVLVSGTSADPLSIMFNSHYHKITMPALQTINDYLRKLNSNKRNALFHSMVTHPISQHIIHKQGFNYQKTPKRFISTYTEKISELGPDLFFQLINEMSRDQSLSHIHNINIPVLIIAGQDDKVIPLPWQELMSKQISKSKWVVIDQGSHVPQVDFPDKVNSAILKWIIEISRGPSY